MNRVLALLCAAAVSIPAIAFADVAPEPCEGSEVGDSCETSAGDSGTCEEGSNGLVCEEGEDSDGSGSEADDGCSTSSSSTGTLPGMALVAGAAVAFFAINKRRKSS